MHEPEAPRFTPVEAAIRARLGVPDAATQVLILSQSSHLDWDWKITFPQLYYQDGQPDGMNPNNPGAPYFFQSNNQGGNYTEPASQIFSNAAGLLQSDPAYYYSICEMGFLREFLGDARFGAQAAVLQQSPRFVVVGGGITSPDNLLSHPEAFIHNYLSGWAFALSAFAGPPALQAWLPDDFGHDSQLPALLRAMGIQSAAFQRVPTGGPVDGSPSVQKQLYDSGPDFVWTAEDGSAVIARWLLGGYGQGDTILNQNIGRDPQQTPVGWMEIYLAQDAFAAQSTPYLFLPVGSDFRIPQGLTDCAAQWNAQRYQTGESPVYAACATYDDFAQLVNAHVDQLPTQPMYATPYWTGCYPMRPPIKQVHNDATRALLAAEAFDQLVAGAVHAPALAAAWDLLAPTTHHDFVPGSASVVVYRNEQLPLLDQVQQNARSVLSEVLGASAAQVGASPQSGEVPFVVFNPLGATTRRPVEVPISFGPFDQVASVRTGGGAYLPVQLTATGTLLFIDTLPSLGYAAYYLSPQPPTVQIPAVTAVADGPLVRLANESLSAALDTSQQCNLTVVNDLGGGDPAANVLGGPANAITVYRDTGNSYGFGCEGNHPENFTPFATPSSAGTASIAENGPLRCSVTTSVSLIADGTTYEYQRTYALVAGEPFLRLSFTGRSPVISGDLPGSAVVVGFPLARTIAGITQGTAAHWTAQPQVFYWEGAPAFQPTRDFAIANGQDGPLGAIYHGSVPAWGLGAFGGTNVLAGCLIRNTGPSYNDDLNPYAVTSWGGTDPEVHTLEYAFRVPSGIADPSTGQVVAEARGYASSCSVSAPGGGPLPEASSLAWVESNAGPALVAALKAGTFDASATFVRVYDPSNVRGNAIRLNLDDLVAAQGGGSFTVQIVTALEQPIDGEQPQPYTSGGVAFTSRGALTTLKIVRA